MNTYTFAHKNNNDVFMNVEGPDENYAIGVLQAVVQNSRFWYIINRIENDTLLCPVCKLPIANCEEGHSSGITSEPENFREELIKDRIMNEEIDEMYYIK